MCLGFDVASHRSVWSGMTRGVDQWVASEVEESLKIVRFGLY